MPTTNPQHTIINGLASGPKTPISTMIAVALPERINGNPSKVAAWVATLFKAKHLTRKNEPYMGYKPGRLFDPGARRMGYATRQGKPWYSVTGPGVATMGTVNVANPAAYLGQQTVQVFPTTGQGGQLAGSYASQPLNNPFLNGSLGEPNSASIGQ